MVRVCTDWFTHQDPELAGFYMDVKLKANLDVYLRNAEKGDDWDFVGLIAGSGRVRIGKSVLMLQILVYWTHQLEKLYGVKVPFNIKDNLVFHGDKLIQRGNLLGKDFPQSALGFDEAGADLESVKVLTKTTKALKDFLRECGQYNFFMIFVIPEFFDLPKPIALNRSDFLINVYTQTDIKSLKFKRGWYNFYSRPNKKNLYICGKKMLNYNAWGEDFKGYFSNFYPVDEKEYREMKRQALVSREEDKEEKVVEEKPLTRFQMSKIQDFSSQRNILLNFLHDIGYSDQKISEIYAKHGIQLRKQTIIEGRKVIDARRIKDSTNEIENNLSTVKVPINL